MIGYGYNSYKRYETSEIQEFYSERGTLRFGDLLGLCYQLKVMTSRGASVTLQDCGDSGEMSEIAEFYNKVLSIAKEVDKDLWINLDPPFNIMNDYSVKIIVKS